MLMQDPNLLAYVGCLTHKNGTDATDYVDPIDRDFYGTPPKWIQLCRQVMGGIELDPASCRVAYDDIVGAKRFFDKEANALEQSWECETMFLNPPYSNKKVKGESRLLEQFAAKFHNEWEAGVIGQAIVLVNNATETKAFDLFSRCATAHAYPRSRIKFVTVTERGNSSNTRAQTFFYYGRRWKRFKRLFSKANCRILREI